MHQIFWFYLICITIYVFYLQNPTRDLMLNEFVTKKNAMGTILRNPEEMEKLKRCVILLEIPINVAVGVYVLNMTNRLTKFCTITTDEY